MRSLAEVVTDDGAVDVVVISVRLQSGVFKSYRRNGVYLRISEMSALRTFSLLRMALQSSSDGGAVS